MQFDLAIFHGFNRFLSRISNSTKSAGSHLHSSTSAGCTSTKWQKPQRMHGWNFGKGRWLEGFSRKDVTSPHTLPQKKGGSQTASPFAFSFWWLKTRLLIFEVFHFLDCPGWDDQPSAETCNLLMFFWKLSISPNTAMDGLALQS